MQNSIRSTAIDALRYAQPLLAIVLGLILSGHNSASTQADESPTAECIAQWDFGAKEDVHRDLWPDGWTRRTGPDYPKFIPIKIHQFTRSAEDLQEIDSMRRIASQCVLAWEQKRMPWNVIPEKTPESIDRFLEATLLNPYLQVQMDGGAAEVASPLIPIDVHSVYFITAQILTDGNEHSARVKLRFLDENRNKLHEVASRSLTGKHGWQSVSTDTLYPTQERLAYAQVVLEVLPNSPKAFRGEFGFDSIKLHRTPRLRLSVDRPSRLYRKGETVVANCTATGMTQEQSSIVLTLVDHNGKKIASANKLFVRQEAQQARLIAQGNRVNKVIAQNYWDGSCEWKLPDLEPGYYEINTRLLRGKSGVFELDEQFVILPDARILKTDSRFGWSMPHLQEENESSFDTLRILELLREGNVGRIKIPIWYDERDADARRIHMDRIDRIQSAGISCVGVIASPPSSILSKFPRINPNDTGSILEDTVVVQSFLEPALRQMCVRIVDFQIGWDREVDFVSNPRFTSSLESIRRLLKRYGQETQLIAAHNPNSIELPVPTIDRWQLSNKEEFTAEEIERILGSKRDHISNNQAPWLSITPIPADKYSLQVRVQDLAARMLAITKDPNLQSTTAWVMNPKSPAVGMLGLDGGPQEMFLPFRSLAGALSGMRHFGSFPMPSLGVNHLVATSDQGRLILWSHQPLTPQIYLGEKVSAMDVWGRKVDIEEIETDHGKEQRFTIGPWPTIVHGVDIKVARWRMGITLEDHRIDPLVGQTQELKIHFANPFGEAVSGRVEVNAPTILMEESAAPFEVAANASTVISVPVQIKPDANTSNALMLLEFTINDGTPIRFAIDEEVQIGTSEFEFDVQYQYDEANQLVVTIDAINHRENPVSFDCLLLIPGRARERSQIANLRERTTKTIVLDNASELVGKTLWLRCQQIGSSRVFNYRMHVQP